MGAADDELIFLKAVSLCIVWVTLLSYQLYY